MKAYLVNELYYGCCYIDSKPIGVFADKEKAEAYVKERNETEEAKEFVKQYAWDDVDCKFLIQEIEQF